MTDKVTQDSPKYRVIKNGLCVYVLQELRINKLTRAGRVYYYGDLREFSDKGSAITALEQLKEENLKAKTIEKLKGQILEVIL